MNDSIFKEIMRMERIKAVSRAITELEIALNTFHGDPYFDDLNRMYEELKEYKRDFL